MLKTIATPKFIIDLPPIGNSTDHNRFKMVDDSTTHSDSDRPSRRSSIGSDPDAPLEFRLLHQAKLEDFNEKTTISSSKVKEKVVEIFTKNLGELIHDRELTEPIKLLCLDRLPVMGTILERMFTTPLDPDLSSSFSSYKGISLQLKAALIEAKDSAGITFSGRSPKLFVWTREQIQETANPLVGFLLEKVDNPSIIASIVDSFKQLFDAANLLVLQIACGDDISDNMQDKKLTKIFAEIPFYTPEQIIEKRQEVQRYRKGIFLDYFDITLKIWNDSIQKLKAIFGDVYFEMHVKDEFLDIHRDVMGSLTYSQFMNSQPQDPSITQESISAHLDPNIMIKCVRNLEKLLVYKLAQEKTIPLPEASDIEIIEKIIGRSQKNAAASNAAATAPRELRENDLSSPFPFAINEQHGHFLEAHGKTFKEEFEKFLVLEKYDNHFLATYGVTDEDTDINFLELLIIRRFAMKKIISELASLKEIGVEIVDSNYQINSLATEALTKRPETADESISMRFIGKLKRHIDLIDKFSEKLSLDLKVQQQFFNAWEQEIKTMRDEAQKIQEASLKRNTEKYIDSFEVFLCMYLIFKRAFDGTI